MKQRGYTLIELMVGMAIASIAITAAVMSIYSIQISVSSANDKNLALANISSATTIIRNDLAMAQSTDLGESPQGSANLSWVDYTTSFGAESKTVHSVQYILSDDKLLRTYMEQGEATEESIAGRNLSSVSFSQSETERGKIVTVTLVSSNATARLAPETVTISVHLRTENQ